MIHKGGNSDHPTTPDALSAIYSMSDDTKSMKKNWSSPAGAKPALFRPDEVDIYCNKVTVEAFIFHGKPVDYDGIDHLEYDHETHTVEVVYRNKQRLDLGVRIEWVVRPYFSKSREVSIVQTRDGQTVAGSVIPLKHKNEKKA